MTAKTASDYFIAGRGISIWVFVLAATATSFSGWTFMGHPGLVYRDGFQYAYASFYAITIPFTGVMFLKRQWMLGKRFGFVTPGEMLSEYFRGDAIRLLVVVVALCFSIPYLGLQLRASGIMFDALTDHWAFVGGFENKETGVQLGMWLLSAVVFIYVASGGLRAVAYVDTLQCILLAFGIIVIGIIALNAVGGWAKLNEGIALLAEVDKKRTPGDNYSHYIAIPGVIQWVHGLAVTPEQKELVKQGLFSTPQGGAWTGMMVLTYMFALMGIHSAPAFSMWAFSNKSPEPFAPQQVWASAFGIGFILFFFTAFQGLGGHLIGADPAMNEIASGDGAGIVQSLIPALGAGQQGAIVPNLINLMSDTAPWLVGLLAVCALAAMQSTGAAYMSTAGGMLTRDILKHFIMPNASHDVQKFWGRVGVGVIVLAALVVATTSKDALVLLGGLAVAFGFQMWPSLMSVCYFPWLTRQGVTVGLFLGIIAVMCTETIGPQFFGIEAWGRWPLTLHSAFWGIFFNLGSAILISAVTQNEDDMKHKMKFHKFLEEHAGLSPEKKKLVPTAWIITLTWFFFGIGPGAVIGNWIFGDPNGGVAAWTFGMPSIWAWQILWWALGVFMMWFLAYKMEMSTVPSKEVKALVSDIGDLGEGKARLDLDKP
ncbi:MAG: hypothetical protein MPJ78_08370 [Hyphomicrobiaceae bacterium]|nr:hypothetical protein [Hyphomicrobiaceae bacterium]